MRFCRSLAPEQGARESLDQQLWGAWAGPGGTLSFSGVWLGKKPGFPLRYPYMEGTLHRTLSISSSQSPQQVGSPDSIILPFA